MENDIPQRSLIDWSIVCLLFITTNLKYISLEVCQNKNIYMLACIHYLRKFCLFLLLLTQGVDGKTFIGFVDFSNIKIYSVSPSLGLSARRIFIISTEQILTFDIASSNNFLINVFCNYCNVCFVYRAYF